MKLNILLLSGCFAAKAAAEEIEVLSPRNIFVDAYKNDVVHDPYLYPRDKELGLGATFNIDLDVFKYRAFNVYWLNKLHFDQSYETGKVIHGGWNYEFGSTIFTWKDKSKVEVFRQHHSRHIFEDTRDRHFPVYDRTGIRFNLYTP